MEASLAKWFSICSKLFLRCFALSAATKLEGFASMSSWSSQTSWIFVPQLRSQESLCYAHFQSSIVRFAVGLGLARGKMGKGISKGMKFLRYDWCNETSFVFAMQCGVTWHSVSLRLFSFTQFGHVWLSLAKIKLDLFWSLQSHNKINKTFVCTCKAEYFFFLKKL